MYKMVHAHSKRAWSDRVKAETIFSPLKIHVATCTHPILIMCEKKMVPTIFPCLILVSLHNLKPSPELNVSQEY